MYTLNVFGCPTKTLESGELMVLPPQDNGTSEWADYKTWLAEGNTPDPAPEPPAPVELTAEEKLAASGLTLEEFAELVENVLNA